MNFLFQTDQFRRAIWQIPAIVVLSVVIGFFSNAVRTDSLPFIGNWSNEGRLTTQGGENLIISLDDARRLFDGKAAFFIDARDSSKYEEGHIKGALNLPWHDIDEHFIDATQGVSQETPIITYCDGETCNLSHDLALFLIDSGFTNVKVLVNGWTVWVESDLPVEVDK